MQIRKFSAATDAPSAVTPLPPSSALSFRTRKFGLDAGPSVQPDSRPLSPVGFLSPLGSERTVHETGDDYENDEDEAAARATLSRYPSVASMTTFARGDEEVAFDDHQLLMGSHTPTESPGDLYDGKEELPSLLDMDLAVQDDEDAQSWPVHPESEPFDPEETQLVEDVDDSLLRAEPLSLLLPSDVARPPSPPAPVRISFPVDFEEAEAKESDDGDAASLDLPTAVAAEPRAEPRHNFATVTMRSVRSGEVFVREISSFQNLNVTVDHKAASRNRRLRRVDKHESVSMFLELTVKLERTCHASPSIWSTWDSSTLDDHTVSRVVIQATTINADDVLPTKEALSRCSHWRWELAYGLPPFRLLAAVWPRQIPFDIEVQTGYIAYDHRATEQDVRAAVDNCARLNITAECIQESARRRFVQHFGFSARAQTARVPQGLEEIFLNSVELSAWFLATQSAAAIDTLGIKHPAVDDVFILGTAAERVPAFHVVSTAMATSALAFQLQRVRRAVIQIDAPVVDPGRMIGAADFALLVVPLAAGLLSAAAAPPKSTTQLEIKINSTQRAAFINAMKQIMKLTKESDSSDIDNFPLRPAIALICPPPTVQRVSSQLRHRSVMKEARDLVAQAFRSVRIGTTKARSAEKRAAPVSPVLSDNVTFLPTQNDAWVIAAIIAIRSAMRGEDTLTALVRALFSEWQPSWDRALIQIAKSRKRASIRPIQTRVVVHAPSLGVTIGIPALAADRLIERELIVSID